MKGKAKKQGPYANSLSESKNKVEEAKLDEDDLIVVPGQGIKRKTGFVQHGQSRVDHEVEMARSDVLATMKNAKAIYQLLKDRSEDEGIEGWVQEKLIKANDYLNSVKEYYDEKMMREMTGGVIAAGGVGEGQKIPASNKPVNPKDLVVPLSSVPVKKPRGHTQYDPAVEFPGVKVFQKAVREADVEEGNAFTAALAKTPPGGKFTVGGKSFTDRSGYDAKLDELAFESLDNQLSALLENEKVAEGLSVSVSKGQQGMPDSVTVSAQDGEADALLGLIKQAGLGLFGDDSQSGYGVPDGSEVAHSHGDIKVVGDHDGMMSLIKKVSGGDEHQHGDYEDEEGGDHGHETCQECGGMMEEGHTCEMVDEVESYGQEEEQVAENNPPDSGAAETTADENAEAAEDMALAKQSQQDKTITTNEGGDGMEDEPVTEWANDAGAKAKDFDEESFDTDIDFITKVISGGLNKQKSTGQTTIPVIAGQKDRMEAHESINQWKKLAGI
jgi:hypothetical protein